MVAREEKLKQGEVAREKCLRIARLQHEITDDRLAAGVLAQPMYEMRIWKKSYIDDEISIVRHPVFKTK